MCVGNLRLLLLAVPTALFLARSSFIYVASSILAAWIALDKIRPEKRARRYEAASFALNGAIAEYERNPDLPVSILTDADQRASEALHSKRIRAAPEWIRSKRLRYRSRILGWTGPGRVGVALVAGTLFFRWRWVPIEHMAFLVGASILLDFGARVWTDKLRKAQTILSEAIDRYEFESAEAKSALGEADRRASEILLGAGGSGNPF